MNNIKGFRRCYTQHSKAYDTEGSEKLSGITIGLYAKDGGTAGEFEVKWHWVDRKQSARLEVFVEGWEVLWQFRDLLEKMASTPGSGITEDDFCLLLDSLKVENITLAMPYSYDK